MFIWPYCLASNLTKQMTVIVHFYNTLHYSNKHYLTTNKNDLRRTRWNTIVRWIITPLVNFTDILRTAFALFFSRQKITNSNWSSKSCSKNFCVQLTPVGNFSSILLAALKAKIFHQKITNPNWDKKKAAKLKNHSKKQLGKC